MGNVMKKYVREVNRATDAHAAIAATTKYCGQKVDPRRSEDDNRARVSSRIAQASQHMTRYTPEVRRAAADFLARPGPTLQTPAGKAQLPEQPPTPREARPSQFGIFVGNELDGLTFGLLACLGSATSDSE